MFFLQSVIETLAQKAGWQQLRNYTLVFPMQRAELYTKLHLQNLIRQSGYDKPVVLPRMLTIDQLIDDLSDIRTVDEIRAVCQLYNCYKQHLTNDAQQLSLDAFYGWGRQLLNDFSTIDMSLLDCQKVMGHVAAAQELDITQLDDDLREALAQLMNISNSTDDSIEQFFRDLWTRMPAIYEDFCALQQANKQGTKGYCYRWVVEHLDQQLPRLEGRTIVFVGFNYLQPAEKQLMTLLHNRQQALFFWDDDPQFTLDPSVYHFIRENRQTLPDARGEETPQATAEKKAITAIETQSCNAQAQYVADWLHNNHHPGQRTAIVIADESVLEAVLYALPEEYANRINITKGYPLRNTHTYTEVVRFLSDPANDRRPDETSFTAVLQRLADHLTLPQTDPEATTAEWRDILRTEAYCQTLLVINRFRALIEEGVLQDVTELRTLRNLLRRSLDSVTLPFHGEPIEEIQVIGVLETRLLDFDNVLILNVEEGVVPGASTDRSFIPFDLRRAYHIQSHEEESKVYAYNFFRLLRRAHNTTLLFSQGTVDTTKKTMSRFLMQMLISDAYQVTRHRLDESTITAKSVDIKPNKIWTDMLKGPDKNGTLPTHLSLSPSALSTYIECPRQFYLRYIEGISEADTPTLILAPNELGSLIHGALEHAYMQIAGVEKFKAITPITPQQIEAYIAEPCWMQNSDAAIDAGYREVITNYNKHHDEKNGAERYKRQEHLAENEVVRQMLYNVLKHDTQLHNLRIVRQEQYCTRRLTVDNQTIEIGGYIDRLDIAEIDGQDTIRIVDYKTGSYDDKKMKANSIAELFEKHEPKYVLQTLIYSAACQANRDSLKLPSTMPIMPNLLFTQKLSGDPRVSITGQPVTDFAKEQEAFDDALTTHLQKMLHDTEFPQCDDKACTNSFCSFHILCNRQKKD